MDVARFRLRIGEVGDWFRVCRPSPLLPALQHVLHHHWHQVAPRPHVGCGHSPFLSPQIAVRLKLQLGPGLGFGICGSAHSHQERRGSAYATIICLVAAD
eukprot:443244-Pyramimonas_sp.AAC.5